MKTRGAPMLSKRLPFVAVSLSLSLSFFLSFSLPLPLTIHPYIHSSHPLTPSFSLTHLNIERASKTKCKLDCLACRLHPRRSREWGELDMPLYFADVVLSRVSKGRRQWNCGGMEGKQRLRKLVVVSLGGHISVPSIIYLI